MTYQVLARKWRPPRFADVVGQQTVTRTLENAIKSSRIAHAFLFSGMRGVGKTTTARILAKALNCREGLTPEPCGECPSCVEIAASNSVDVLEIDAASNTGVDNIREIRESVRYGTARDRFKIFIIDEVHMLSTAAFNALLKTLEEPPPHVKFILATTELNKIPVTITSRCQQFDFKPIPFSLLLERLRLICGEEGIQISEYGLRAVAISARGSMRDAQSALDQVIALSGQKVSDDDIRTLLGVVDEAIVAKLVEAVLDRDGGVLLTQMREVAESGVNPQSFCAKFIAHVRNLMVCKVAGWNESLLHLPDSDKEQLESQAERFSELDLIRFYDLLNRVENELRFHPHPFVHIEMALMKLVELSQLPALEAVINRIGSGDAASSPPSPAEAKPTPPARTAAPVQPKPKNRSADRPASSPKPPASEAVKASAPEEGLEPTGGHVNPREVVKTLRKILQKEEIMLASSLDHASAVEFQEGRLRIVFPRSESFHSSIVGASEKLERVALACARITGSKPTVEVTLEEAARSEGQDPLEDPRFKTFYDAFPGKYVIDRKSED